MLLLLLLLLPLLLLLQNYISANSVFNSSIACVLWSFRKLLYMRDSDVEITWGEFRAALDKRDARKRALLLARR